MKQHLKKLATAAVLSTSVFVINYYWYQSTATQHLQNSNEKPLAYVGQVIEDIQRRPAARLLWQSVNQGEALFNGEAIRTSERGEVRIQFAGTDKYLDLEPESLIVIKQSAGEIALDLLEGSLFVNASQGSSNPEDSVGLVLNSAKGKVDLSRATVSLSKSKDNEVNVQVIEGSASIKTLDGKTKELTSGKVGSLGLNGELQEKSQLKILSPQPGKPIFRNAEKMEPIEFSWSGIPENTEVSLWVGNNRKNLSLIEKTATGKITTTLPFGKKFWKLVAKSGDQTLIESPIYRSEIIPRTYPTFITPQPEQEFETQTDTLAIQFKWQKPDLSQSVTLEIASDSQLKNKFFTQNFKNELEATIPNLQPGSYFWRYSFYSPDETQPYVGPIHTFKIKKYSPQKVDLAWADPSPEAVQTFVTNPEVALTWQKPSVDNVQNYRVTVKSEDSDNTEILEQVVAETSFKTPVARPGRYVASIEALDANGTVIGAAPQKILDVKELPKIPAPQFAGEGNIIKASNDGKVELSWTSPAEAKEYELVISKDGKEIKRLRYQKNKTSIKNLMPGNYQAQLIAIDKHGRPSENYAEKTISVPENSGLKAPSLKKIKVN
ncbi:MAG: hypothetical protein ACLGGX_02530 [Bdellovibrionia bacterium]